MDKFWKIPKQWVSDFGLSWNEAGLLADMVEWDCPMQEHAARCRLTERTLSNALDSIAEKAEKFSVASRVRALLSPLSLLSVYSL